MQLLFKDLQESKVALQETNKAALQVAKVASIVICSCSAPINNILAAVRIRPCINYY